MTTIIVTVIFLAAVIGFIMIMKNKKAGEAAKNDSPQPPPEKTKSSPAQEYNTIMDSLLRLNILLRKDADLPDEMRDKIEAIVDDLIAITPAMMERYPGEALTYEIKKIGSSHLFKTVKEFLDLSVESRNNQLAVFTKTIENLHDVSHRSRDIVEKNETAEFKTMANFLAGKFS